MSEKKIDQSHDAQAARLDRRFTIAVIAYAIIEFIGIIAVIYYKTAR
ncbi:MAG: hypothetical protein AABN33_25965 [Acidobacteriota bacterium]